MIGDEMANDILARLEDALPEFTIRPLCERGLIEVRRELHPEVWFVHTIRARMSAGLDLALNGVWVGWRAAERATGIAIDAPIKSPLGLVREGKPPSGSECLHGITRGSLECVCRDPHEAWCTRCLGFVHRRELRDSEIGDIPEHKPSPRVVCAAANYLEDWE